MEPEHCGYCDKPLESDGETPTQLWSSDKKQYLSTCSSCYGKAIATYRKRLLKKARG